MQIKLIWAAIIVLAALDIYLAWLFYDNGLFG